MDDRTRKRKLGTVASTSSRKKLKRTHRPTLFASNKIRKSIKPAESVIAVAPENLPWKAVPTHGNVGGFGNEEDGGILALEEVEGVEVVYGDGDGGKVIGFRIKEQKAVATSSAHTESAHEHTGLLDAIVIDVFDTTLLPSWSPYSLHAALLHSIHKRGFEQPTEIQMRTFEVFKPAKSEGGSGEAEGHLEESSMNVRGRDIVGIAQTGSGKTLAYGLPILHHLLTSLSTTSEDAPTTITVRPPVATRRVLQALILAPTRELALQVSEHLNACLDHLFKVQSQAQVEIDTDKPDASRHKRPPPVSVAAIVGGMSAQKQRRILSRGVDILVATPGRFWDLCGEDPSLTSQLRSLRFLVLDEADRMVEAGHFQELESILRITSRPPPDMDTDEAVPQETAEAIEVPSIDKELAQERNEALQTFVFSATMSKDLQRDLKRKGVSRSHTKRREDASSTLDDLLMKLDFRDPEPMIIDLSPKGGRVEGLQESKVECLTNDKDVYLYYFLLRHPGRSLVFLSSIDGIRRLMPILELLKLSAWPLHSGLQQKQRLKNLDRFKSTSNSVLLATDVAARGLDVIAVDHVIHYQVPRSADAYVHRNGRTARAMKQGFGLVLCAPDERRVFKSVLTGLGRDEDDVPELNMEHDILDKLKVRIQLARQIDSAAHRAKKKTHDKNWMRETAEAMELELGSDFDSDTSENAAKTGKQSQVSKVSSLKAQLNQTLSQPLVARGVSTRYLTSGSRSIVDDLIEGANHETILGLQKAKAGSETVRKQKADSRKKSR
ncbi:P-loop containing nucleoside triphosphate hydrolase protein [Gautieria morchelliformis]|nr:P-loop containing nucleoside triphosphate hydrolase protein [Gautieria morchelliformis]